MEDRFAQTIVVVAATVVASTTVANNTSSSHLQRNETQLLSLQYCGTDRPG